MSDYTPPVEEMLFLLFDVLGFADEDMDRETVQAVLEEAAKLASGELAPLNADGDKAGATLEGETVKTAPGFKEAYRHYCEGGWNAVPFDPEYGGQGLPWALAFPVQEMWQGANLSFGLCPLLNQGAVEAISTHGTAAQKALYLPHLISGEWTGTMNLTESQAGSDLGLLRAKAERREDGAYTITGQKIFITYGEHDMAENIIHLVLARLPDAPEDVRGISLFIVPKILEDGTRNAVRCIGLEHKLGIHASPTCTMEFDGATGYLLGTENEGLKCMFTMMNNARLSVGLQGVALAERAYQHAASYAQERVQREESGKW
ncbi:MAG: acyl-CoA dehydrogenase family protein [Alphaproteobacteria bacterium]